jgi:hypothetical protein
MKKLELSGYIAHMGEMSNAYKGFVTKTEARDRLEDLGLGGRVIIRLILETYCVD